MEQFVKPAPEQILHDMFNPLAFRRELSVQVGIPLYAADPKLQIWGTKSGSRQIFREVPHPDGSEGVSNLKT